MKFAENKIARHDKNLAEFPFAKIAIILNLIAFFTLPPISLVNLPSIKVKQRNLIC